MSSSMSAPLRTSVDPVPSSSSAVRTAATPVTPSMSDISSTTSSGTGVAPSTTKSEELISLSSPTSQSLNAVPDTVTRVTRKRPITSAFAVVAVRLGLRAMLSAAIRPVSERPSKDFIARPISRASRGPPMTTPRNRTSAPRPSTSGFEMVNRLTSSDARPMASRMPPTHMRTAEVPDVSTAAERIASTGRVRPALKAGSITATTVMSVPATSVTITIAGVRAIPALGIGTSNRSSTHWTTRPSRTPASSPAALASSPSSSPSPSSDLRTWAGVPPMERMRASSRLLCVTTTVKVL